MLNHLSDYQDWLNSIKQRVISTRMRMARAANNELIAFFRFYCQSEIWQQPVAKLLDRPWLGVNEDLAIMLGQIHWGHNILIFTKSNNLEEARFYISHAQPN